MGLCKSHSQELFGYQSDGIYHTAVSVYGTEYYCGSGTKGRAEGSSPGLEKAVDFGETKLDKETFLEFIKSIHPKYSRKKYDLAKNNCNHYSNEIIEFLTGNSVPKELLDQASEVIKTPIGKALTPFIQAQLGAFLKREADIFKFIDISNGEVTLKLNILALMNNISNTQDQAIAKLDDPDGLLAISDSTTLRDTILETPKLCVYLWSPEESECKKANEEISQFAKNHTSEGDSSMLFVSVNTLKMADFSIFIRDSLAADPTPPQVYLYKNGFEVKKQDTFSIVKLQEDIEAIK
ncbi:unnamed protein product [Moneuplotes crassus]|uniref:PPPDE domain-containing protein n=1 Tax=Euplotes crassus TaxID=5936 RepID=A0AAD1XMZ4_EUPCR|nr:unnamed protein product [Moneuplotes crassus]